MSITIKTPDPDVAVPAYCGDGSGCVCFEESALIVPGTKFATDLTIASLPADGDDFEFGGITWTFRTAPTLDWEIEIGANTTVAATNMATAFYTHEQIDRERYFAISLVNVVTVGAVKVGASYSLAFVAGTAPVSQTSTTAGVDETLTTPYVLKARMMMRATDSPSDYESSGDILVQPFVEADTETGELSATMCVPMQSFAQGILETPFPDPTYAGAPVVLHTPVAECFVRWSVNSGPWYESAKFRFIPARCAPEDGLGLQSYSEPVSGLQEWLLHDPNNSWCYDARPYLYALITDAAHTLTITHFAGPPSVYAITAPYKWGILAVNVAELLPPGYTGTVMVDLSRAGATYRTITMEITSKASCDCETSIIFLNDFGVYESVPAGSRSEEGVEVTAEEFTGCADCLNSGGRMELRNTYSETFIVYTRKGELTPTRRAQLISLLTSPDVRVQSLENGEYITKRVRVQRGSVILKPGQQNVAQVALEVTTQDKQTNSNH